MAEETKKQRRQRRSFSPEFKAGAVKLVLDERKPLAQVGRDLDVLETSLRQWVGREKADRGSGKPGALTSPEREELSSLRSRVRELEMQRDILKKAAAFFAKEMK